MSGIVNKIFGHPDTPTPPPDQYAQEQADLKAKQDQADASNAAQAEAQANGRRSTIAAGDSLAAQDQYGRGLALRQKRTTIAASQQLLG